MAFYKVFVVVEPKRRALDQANRDLASARGKLAELKDRIQVNHLLLAETISKNLTINIPV